MEKTAEFSEKTIVEIASILHMPVVELEQESLRVYLQKRLGDVEALLEELKKQYQVTTSEQMENLYREGKLAEENTWQDFFRFDHLEEETSLDKTSRSGSSGTLCFLVRIRRGLWRGRSTGCDIFRGIVAFHIRHCLLDVHQRQDDQPCNEVKDQGENAVTQTSKDLICESKDQRPGP